MVRNRLSHTVGFRSGGRHMHVNIHVLQMQFILKKQKKQWQLRLLFLRYQQLHALLQIDHIHFFALHSLMEHLDPLLLC